MPRTYVVTGSASGIGAATSRLLTAAGHAVIGVDRQDADVIADLSTPGGRQAAVAAVTERASGSLDAVIACAGVAGASTMSISVNYFGAVEMLAGLRPLLAQSPAPRAVVTSSVASLSANNPALVDACLGNDETAALAIAERMFIDDPQDAKGEIYASGKRAVSRCVRRLAITPDWAGQGIALNAVAPSVTKTGMTKAILEAGPEALAAIDQASPQPLNHHMEPEVIGRLQVWLAGEENTHLCGQTIYCDGGVDATLRGDDIWTGAATLTFGRIDEGSTS